MNELKLLTHGIPPLMQGRFAIVGPGSSTAMSTNATEYATVIVRDGKIPPQVRAAKFTVPYGVTVIDGRGRRFCPASGRCTRISRKSNRARPIWPPASLQPAIAAANSNSSPRVRDPIENGRGPGSATVLAGLVDRSGTERFGVNWADTPEQGREPVARYKAAGFTQMKIYSRIKPDTLRAVAAEAHRQGMTVTGHMPEGMTAIQRRQAGMDQINHFGPDPPGRS